MKAARLITFGDKDSVLIKDIEKPAVSEGKILIEVYAAGVNPVDWKVRSGMMQIPLPITLGGDLSGVIVEIGSGVSDFKKGDAVYGQASIFNGGTGSFAQYDLANPQSIALKSKSLNFHEAGALPLTGVSGLQALTEHIKLIKGQKILIHGGAGGIGSIAIQLAKHVGASVATTVRADDKDYVKSLGADEVIDYKTQKFEEILKDFDAVYDTVGGETTTKSFQVLKKNGVLVSMLGQPDVKLAEKYGITAIGQNTKVNKDRLDKLTELVDAGAIKVHIDKIFPLEQANDALSYLQTTHHKGKVLLEIKHE